MLSFFSCSSFFARAFWNWYASHAQCFPYHRQKGCHSFHMHTFGIYSAGKALRSTHVFSPWFRKLPIFHSIALSFYIKSYNFESDTVRGRKKSGIFCIDPILKQAKKNPLIAWIYFITISILPFAQKPKRNNRIKKKSNWCRNEEENVAKKKNSTQSKPES